MAPRDDRGPNLSRDGKFYWDGSRWVPVPREPLSTVLPAAILAVVIILGGAWVLNNTRLGYEIKCQYLGDNLACLTLLFNAPVTSSTGDLGYAVDEYTAAIAEIESAVGESRVALDEMRDTYENDFLVELGVRPMNSFQKETVLFSLENLAFARESVAFTLESVDWAEDDAERRRGQVISAAAAGRTMCRG